MLTNKLKPTAGYSVGKPVGYDAFRFQLVSLTFDILP